MKIKVKYYNEWGTSQFIILGISSKGRVRDLRQAIKQHTNCSADLLYLLEGKQLHLLKGDMDYLSSYKFSKDTLIVAQQQDDQFSPTISLHKSQATSKHQSFNEQQFYIEFGSITSKSSQFKKEIDFFENDIDEFFEAIRLNRFEDVVKCVEKNGKQQSKQLINNVAVHGWSSMHLSVVCGNEKIFLYLLGEGGDITIETKDGWDCLTIAVWQRKKILLNLMLSQQKLNINKITKHGSALHLAAEIDDKEILQLLLNHPKIDTKLLNNSYQMPIDLAGSQTKNILLRDLRQSFQLSMSGLQLSNLSTNSFLVNRPERPPIITGHVLKSSFFKLILSRQFVIVDPDVGVITRFKQESDVPLNPKEIISLECVHDVRQSKNEWFQKDAYNYIEIKYNDDHIYIALEHRTAARQWYEALRNCVGYYRYIKNKMEADTLDQHSSSRLNIVAFKLMMERNNEIINIKDIRAIDQKEYLRQQQEIKKLKFQQSLESVSEASQLEKDNEIEHYFQQTFNSKKMLRMLKITNFEIIQQIGKGSFGNVYKSRLKLNNKLYALKQQDKDKILKNNLMKYVQSEMEIMQRLHHPFIISMDFSFQTQFYLYLAINYCPQGDLSKYMTRGTILDEFTAKFIVSQIILAIEYLHSKQIIYRDLKPENILLDESGYIKLTDFGLSKQFDDPDFVAQSFCGSPAYLSPEMISGDGSSKATDIYQIGTILYEMLTGYPPFYCHNLKKLMHDIRYSKVIMPKNISNSAANLLSKLLEKNPQARLGENNIAILKKHIFFAEIDWSKLAEQKYIPPKLKLREDCQINRNGYKQNSELPEQFDLDYQEGEEWINYFQNWNYGY